MAQEYMADLVRGLFSNRTEFPEDSDGSGKDSSEESEDQCGLPEVSTDGIKLEDEGLNIYKPCTKDSTDGTSHFVVSAVEESSIAHGFGLQEGDRLCSGNDCSFAKVEDIRTFFSTMRQGSQSFSLKIMRETYDPTSGQREQKVIVINESYYHVCVTKNPEVACQVSKDGWKYLKESEEIRRIKLNKNGYYVVVNHKKELSLNNRVPKKDLKVTVFKIHRFNDTDDPNGAVHVILEHETKPNAKTATSRLWVSMTQFAVSMVLAGDVNSVAHDNTCVFKMVHEVGGGGNMNFTFQSHHLRFENLNTCTLKKPGDGVYFLGFGNDITQPDRFSPVEGFTNINGQDDNRKHDSTVFTLY